MEKKKGKEKKRKRSDAVVSAGNVGPKPHIAAISATRVMKPNVLLHRTPKGVSSPLKANNMVCFHAPELL